MGCGASSSLPVEAGREHTPPSGRTPPVGGETKTPDDRPSRNGEAAVQSNGDPASGSNAAREAPPGAPSAQAAQQIATFTTHVMTDSRGAKVSTVIQNKSKVDTMCKWADNVLKARVASGGVFANPQDGRTRRSQQPAAPPEHAATTSSVGGDTASVSSRHAANSRTEYGSMASNGLMGVSTTAQGASASQSRGNLTVVAQRGSDEEDPNFSPTRVVDAEDAPAPIET